MQPDFYSKYILSLVYYTNRTLFSRPEGWLLGAYYSEPIMLMLVFIHSDRQEVLFTMLCTASYQVIQ